MKLQITICDEEGEVLKYFAITPGPRDKDVPTLKMFASRVKVYLGMRYKNEEIYEDEE